MQTNKSVFRNYKLNEIYLKNNKLIIKQNSAFSSLEYISDYWINTSCRIKNTIKN